MRLPLGLSDFRALRQDGYRYVDKTALVDAVVGADAQVMVLPKLAGKPGVVMELESIDTDAGETSAQALTAALAQIRTRDYAAELRERGATPIHELAAVFDGKRAYVRVG